MITRTLAAAAAAALAIALAPIGLGGAVTFEGIAPAMPVAGAVPGDPLPNCETGIFGSIICDGPIRPDGTWKRCLSNPGVGGMYPQPPTTSCRIVNPATPDDFWTGYGLGAPRYHIQD